MSRIIVLRPEPGASETIERAASRGLESSSIPLFALEGVSWKAPDVREFDALLLTSANALRFGGESLQGLRGLPVHAVGKATANAAREAGFDIASSGDDGVERLLGSIDPDLKLLHLCGEDRLAPEEPRQQITVLSVYRSRAIEPAPLIGDIGGAIVLVHSPRAGKRLADLTTQQTLDRRNVAIIAISAAAADSVGKGWKSVDHAEQPSDEALLALVERLCDKQRQG